MKLLVAHLVGGHLSVAPEHVVPSVLRLMRKPPIRLYDAFAQEFAERSKAVGKEQYLTPYFIASFPGSTEEDMRALMRYLKLTGRRLQQIQDFLPSPMTLATAMYHAECDWKKKQPIFVAKTAPERRTQRELLLYHKQEKKHERPERKRRPGRKRR
jgi:radical SAM superfamily enzyme YgiQ (UPF0313 family)